MFRSSESRLVKTDNLVFVLAGCIILKYLFRGAQYFLDKKLSKN